MGRSSWLAHGAFTGALSLYPRNLSSAGPRDRATRTAGRHLLSHQYPPSSKTCLPQRPSTATRLRGELERRVDAVPDPNTAPHHPNRENGQTRPSAARQQFEKNRRKAGPPTRMNPSDIPTSSSTGHRLLPMLVGLGCRPRPGSGSRQYGKSRLIRTSAAHPLRISTCSEHVFRGEDAVRCTPCFI